MEGQKMEEEEEDSEKERNVSSCIVMQMSSDTEAERAALKFIDFLVLCKQFAVSLYVGSAVNKQQFEKVCVAAVGNLPT
ncbi:hypothetical protein FQN60_003591 [Etheostoma spectabile]|uniref:Uncharacterized protein n=1 Tax=Etheostoma spectabile TaxID=54343 RepID=A0A5J5CSV2_9PERO|nr:hypothetical protein FQN60_003591 [Etheostoma spectabile]